MSKLLKSKFLLGVLVLGAFVFTNVASAAITSTLKQGSNNSQVKELQQWLNASGFTVSTTGAGSVGLESNYFGAKTKSAVVRFQASKGLTADGIVGPATRAALVSSGSTTYPAGCTSTSGFSPTTGLPCNGTVVNPTLPAGCSSTAGFSATTGQPCNGGTTVNNGPVAVSLATNNPASSTLVGGQATADLAHFTFTGNGVVTGVTLQRIGVSADSTLSNVYLFDGATRLTDAASVGSNGTVTFTAPAGLFTVNGSKTISVKSDIASVSGQTVGVQLSSFTTSAGTVNANLSGNIHTIASATLAAVTTSIAVTPSGATLNPGANVTLWQETVTVSNRDVWMKRLALRNVGSAPASAFANFKLFVNGVQVATATGLDANGYVTFDMNSAPVLVASGSRVLRVDADILSGASRTVQLSLRTAADADFVDSSFGVNVTPGMLNGSASGTALPWAAGTVNTISGTSGGTLTIEKDSSSTSGNVSEGTNDKVLGIFKVTAYGEPMKIETLKAAFYSSDAAVNSLRNGRIMIGGVQYGSTATLVTCDTDSDADCDGSDTSGTGTSYTLNYTVMPGTPVLMELRGDVYDNDGTDDLSNSDTLIGVIAVGSSNVQRVDSLGSASYPGSIVVANSLTVADASATLTKNATYANQSVALPATNFKVGSWNLAGSSTEDILLTTLSFDVDSVTNATFSSADFSTMYVVVKNGATVVAQPSPLATVSATDNNFSLNYTLAKNTTVTVELYANLGSTVTAADSVKTDLTATGTAMVSGASINASSGDVDGQTITAGSATITVSKDASSPVTAIVYDNQTVTTLAAKFDAVTAGYNITDMTVTVGASANTVIQTVFVYDGANIVAQGPMTTATTAVFNGLSVNVPANSSKVLTVKLQLGNVGVGAGTTGATLTTSIAAATHVIYVNTSTGVSTATSSEEAGTATGSTMYVYASIPTVNRVALPTTVLASGTQVLAKFDVVSNGGTIAWKEVLFDITKSAAPTISSVELWDVTGGGNTQVTAVETFQNGTGGVASTCVADNTFCELMITVGTKADDNVEEQVSGTKTYEVRATIAGTLAAANSINTSITSNLGVVTPAVFTTNDNDTTVNDATFVWSDMSAQSHDTGTADWVNENLVRVLPTSTWTMTYPN